MITSSSHRPDSLLEIALRAQSAVDNYPAYVKEFLDELRQAEVSSVRSRIEAEPVLTGNPVFDAHLAGLAEQIAVRYGVSRPEWVHAASRFLAEPVFFGGRHSRALMIATTSFGMRRRNLFCGAVEW